jgi:hypothetical protein
VGGTHASKNSKGRVRCAIPVAQDLGGLASHIEKSGELSPMKIRIGSFLRASRAPDSHYALKSDLLPPLKFAENPKQSCPALSKMDPPRCMSLQSAAYAASNACGWFSDNASVSAASRGNCRRSLPPIEAHASKENANSQSGKGVECAAAALPSAGPSRSEALSCAPADDRLGSSRLALDRESIRFMGILPNISAAAQSQDDSRFLQEYIPVAFKKGLPPLAFDAFLRDLFELSLQQFGHVVVLTLLEVSTAEQTKVLVERLASQVGQLSRDPHGCRVIQKAVKVAPTECAETLIERLKDDVVQCIKNMHANHVIQVCIQELPSCAIAFIINAVELWGADSAASHIYGCRVVMRLLEHIPQSQLQTLLEQILQKTPKLAQDRYGNYVLQHIVDHGCLSDRQALVSEVLKHGALEMALQKYAHNVVEKCVRLTMARECYQTECASLSQELLWKDGLAPVLALASSRFGVKVLLCFLKHLDRPNLERLRHVLIDGKQRWQDLAHAEQIMDELNVDI